MAISRTIYSDVFAVTLNLLHQWFMSGLICFVLVTLLPACLSQDVLDKCEDDSFYDEIVGRCTECKEACDPTYDTLSWCFRECSGTIIKALTVLYDQSEDKLPTIPTALDVSTSTMPTITANEAPSTLGTYERMSMTIMVPVSIGVAIMCLFVGFLIGRYLFPKENCKHMLAQPELMLSVEVRDIEGRAETGVAGQGASSPLLNDVLRPGNVNGLQASLNPISVGDSRIDYQEHDEEQV